MRTEIDDLINEVRLLFNVLVQQGERIHSSREVTMAQRAVLEFLQQNGAATVPQIARRRRVSRQHIQNLVNPLLDDGLLERIPNPAHKRSSLVGLSEAGERLIRDMRTDETKALERASLSVSARELAQVTRLLRSVRRSFESIA